MVKHPSARTALELIASAAVFVTFCTGAGYWHERILIAQTAAAAPLAKKSTARPAILLHPHPQAKLPPLDLPTYQLPRSNDVVRTLYKYAAEHPEVLNYMPCFCGCEARESGHRSNEDCFVKARARNGDVTTWEEHGIACAMCLSVAEQAMKMTAAGASLKDVRAEVERKYGHITGNRTPTPAPPPIDAAIYFPSLTAPSQSYIWIAALQEERT